MTPAQFFDKLNTRIHMFNCPYAEPYSLIERLIGTSADGVPLSWEERIFAYPSICPQQLYLKIITILAIIILIFIVWKLKFKKKEPLYYLKKK